MVDFTKLFAPSMNDPNVSATRGYNMALGVMSREMLSIYGEKVFSTLLKNCIIKKS
jgi:hypothetical protein